jgi:hypothetical protein
VILICFAVCFVACKRDTRTDNGSARDKAPKGSALIERNVFKPSLVTDTEYPFHETTPRARKYKNGDRIETHNKPCSESPLSSFSASVDLKRCIPQDPRPGMLATTMTGINIGSNIIAKRLGISVNQNSPCRHNVRAQAAARQGRRPAANC